MRWMVYFCVAAVLLAGTFCRAEGNEANSPGKLKEVIIVMKMHYDIGYTQPVAELITRYRTTMIDDALNVVEQNRKLPPEWQLVWTIPGWPMEQILWFGQESQRRANVMEAFKSGRFVVHALPFKGRPTGGQARAG